MKFKNASLAEVAAVASKTLFDAGIPVVVVGGSAVTLHAPDVYTSRDIDFAALRGTTRRAFAAAVAPLGFRPAGRDFVHPETPYTLDLVADTPYIDQRAVTEFATVKTRRGPVTVYKLEDALADRVAAFLHWADLESLGVAERALLETARAPSWSRIEAALRRLDATGAGTARRFELALSRLQTAHRRRRHPRR